MDGGDTLSGCDTQSVNNDASQDTQYVSMEGSSSKDTQSVQSEIQNMKQNMSAMLSVVQQMGEAWSTLDKKRHSHDLDSDSDSPPPKSNRSEDQDYIADLFNNCNKSEDEDDNWDLLK